jgi:transcriptional regulator with XRE-family HTH domain
VLAEGEPQRVLGALLRQHRVGQGLSQEALAAKVSPPLSVDTISKLERSRTRPYRHTLEALCVALELDGVQRAELEHARRVWGAPDVATTIDRHRRDWGEAPEIVEFFGRAHETTTLERWMLADGCRVVAVLGGGGIGKTTLASWLAHTVANDFESVYWRSLRNAPLPSEWLAGAIGFMSSQPLRMPDGEPARVELLLDLLGQTRCLLVLDNLESVLEPGDSEARYRDGYAGYGMLVDRLGASKHQGCLVVTSREEPPEVGAQAGERASVRVLELSGLSLDECRTLLHDKHLTGDLRAWASLVSQYRGNGLALKIVGETIRQVFGGDIASFLNEGQVVFGGVRRLLDTQISRLSQTESLVLNWLAIEREPVSFGALMVDIGPEAQQGAVLEAVEALRRRSLLEDGERRATFTLQPVVLEFTTDRLVQTVAHEIAAEQPVILASHALLKATARDYVRRSQERLIARPTVEGLITRLGGRPEVEQHLTHLLTQLRAWPPARHGYAPGNILNLLRLLRGDLRGLDLSRLTIRQAYLQHVEMQDASFAGAQLSESVVSDAFDSLMSVALDVGGVHLAAGSTDGELRVRGRPGFDPVGGRASRWSVGRGPEWRRTTSGQWRVRWSGPDMVGAWWGVPRNVGNRNRLRLPGGA